MMCFCGHSRLFILDTGFYRKVPILPSSAKEKALHSSDLLLPLFVIWVTRGSLNFPIPVLFSYSFVY